MRSRAGKAPESKKQRFKHRAGTVLPGKHWTTNVGKAAGHPAAFLVVIVYALLWLTFSPATFDWNAVATLAVFVMTLFIQRANRRDNLALHAKLDELLRVDNAARSELTQLDEEEPEVIARHRDEEVRKTGTSPNPGWRDNECRRAALIRNLQTTSS
jgi:low affinity Fe/Cu permease